MMTSLSRFGVWFVDVMVKGENDVERTRGTQLRDDSHNIIIYHNLMLCEVDQQSKKSQTDTERRERSGRKKKNIKNDN